MLAQLLLIVITVFGPIEIRFPMPTMATCESYLADPTPILVTGDVPVVGGGSKCIAEPTDPGKPA